MQYLLILILPLLFLGCSSSEQPKPLYHYIKCDTNIYSLKSAECLDADEFITNIEPYSVIFIGDHHNSIRHHKFIAATVERLHKKGYKIHFANEWFTPKDNKVLDRYASGLIDDEKFKREINWTTRKYLNFNLFSPIYHSVIKTKGKLYGINLSKPEKQRISDVNFAFMSVKEKEFFHSLDLNVYAHRTYLAPFFNYCHRAKNGESNQQCIERMYRVQVAWDTKMAKESAKLAKTVLQTKKDKLIIFVGAFHLSQGVGVSLRFARESNLPFTTIIPQRKKYTFVTNAEADFIHLYNESQEAINIENNLMQGNW